MLKRLISQENDSFLMGILKIYRIRIPSYGFGNESFYEIPARAEHGWMERTIGLERDLPTMKKYIRNMHSDWQDALILPVRRSDGSLGTPQEGDILRISGHGGITDVGYIVKIILKNFRS